MEYGSLQSSSRWLPVIAPLLSTRTVKLTDPSCNHMGHPCFAVCRYTRNGKLLGDGFVPVHEYNLVPVVGFHSNGESVRVNFGIVPFAYLSLIHI